MRKIIMVAVLAAASALTTGCGCGYSSCISCCSYQSSYSCCGSNGWY